MEKPHFAHSFTVILALITYHAPTTMVGSMFLLRSVLECWTCINYSLPLLSSNTDHKLNELWKAADKAVWLGEILCLSQQNTV